MTGDTKAKGVGAQVETLIRDESMTELEKLARECLARPEPCTDEYSAMRSAWGKWDVAATPAVVLRLLSELSRLRSQVEEMRGALEAIENGALTGRIDLGEARFGYSELLAQALAHPLSEEQNP